MRPADNPFRTERVGRVPYRPQGWTWEDLMVKLQSLNFRAAIVGGQGSGKTRLMVELGARLRDRGFGVAAFRVTPGCTSLPGGLVRSVLPTDGSPRIIMLDEVDRLSAPSQLKLRWASRKWAGLIVTSHEACWLPSLNRCTATAELLEDILHDLVGEELDAIRGLSGRLFREHNGNIQEVLRALFDVYAER